MKKSQADLLYMTPKNQLCISRGLIIKSCLVATALVLFECSASKPDENQTKADSVTTMRSSSSGETKNRTLMEMEYGNQSSKMKLNLDVQSQDVYIRMSGRPLGSEAPQKILPWKKPTSLDSAWNAEQNAGPHANSQQSSPTVNINLAPNGQPANSATPAQPIANNTQPNNSKNPTSILDSTKIGNTDKVVSQIRKAQEYFYKKHYAEARDMVEKSLLEQPTAEGWALLGSTRWMLGDSTGAGMAWTEAQKLNPDLPSLNTMLEKLKKKQ